MIKWLGVRYTVEDGFLFTADRDYRMGIVAREGELHDTLFRRLSYLLTSGAYCSNG